LIPKSHKDRLEFIYEWGNKLAEKDKLEEEYLLGKPID
jgi:hypothetical protein